MNVHQKAAVGPPVALAVSCAMWVGLIALTRRLARR